MRFYRIRGNARWRMDNNAECYCTPLWYMPRILCPARCQGPRGTALPGLCYPAAEFSKYQDLAKALQPGQELPLDQWHELKKQVLACLPYEVLILPQTEFGRVTAEMGGTFADCYPHKYFLISAITLEKLCRAGINELFPVPVSINSRRKPPGEYFQLQIEHTASLATDLDRHRLLQTLNLVKANNWKLSCEVCGRNDGDLPQHVVLKGSTIPANVSLFRLRERPTEIFCTQAFAETVQRLKLTNILVQEVETDGSETTLGFAEPHIARPELWGDLRSAATDAPTERQGRLSTKPSQRTRRTGRQAPPLAELLAQSSLGKKARMIASLERLSVQFTLTPNKRLRIGKSRFGGLPDLPVGSKWPGGTKARLDFLLQINLSEVASVLVESPLPSKGFMWFFYDTDKCPWGLDSRDRAGWEVVYFEGPVSRLRPAALPDWLPENALLPECALELAVAPSLPSLNSPLMSPLALSSAETESYRELLKAVQSPDGKEVSIHKLLGYSDTIQSEMAKDCQQAFGQYATQGKSAVKKPPSGDDGKAMLEWLLLLQLDSDDIAGMQWADGGRLYFWLRNQDLIDRRFDRCWVILQSY